MTNPLLSPSTLPYGLPDYGALSDADFAEAMEVGMAEHLAELAEIADHVAPATVENVLEAWERSGATLTRALNAFWPAKAAHRTDEREAIIERFAPLLAAHGDAISLNQGLYRRVVALAERVAAGEIELDEQDGFLLSERRRGFERNGIALDEPGKQRLREINTELAKLQTAFEERVLAGRNAAGIHITDASHLVGLSEGDLAVAREDAARAGLDGWFLTVTNTTDQPLLGSLAHRGTREALYRASIARGLGGEHDTRDVLLAMLRLRHERARLLGYAHHADYVASDGCAGSTAAVNEILARLAAGAVVNANREAAEFAEVFAELYPGETFEAWDWTYVAERVRGRVSIDEEQLRPYLEFERVLTEGVFAAATALYGITFHEVVGLVGYTEQARTYEVREADGSVLGAVVIDPFTRPTKQGGAWMTSIVEQSHLLGTAPLVTNTCNFNQPAPGQPSLLTWDNVITLFHEFGHDLHGLLSAVRHPSRSGTSVPRDFVEFPSQVNEIWAWHPELLARYAVHHETGEPLPAEWIESLRAARSFNEGFANTAILAAMLLDQAWHQADPADLPTSPEGVEEFERAALAAAGVDHPLIAPRYRTTYFSHIFGGGYAAAYYSYIWSEVMDADTVAWFEGHPNGGLGREAGDRFRRELLARGGSIKAMDAYRRFRGADPDLSHLLIRMGVA